MDRIDKIANLYSKTNKIMVYDSARAIGNLKIENWPGGYCRYLVTQN